MWNQTDSLNLHKSLQNLRLQGFVFPSSSCSDSSGVFPLSNWKLKACWKISSSMKWKGPHLSDCSQTQPLLKGFCCNSDGESASWTSCPSFVSISIFASLASTSFSWLASSSLWGASTKTPSPKGKSNFDFIHLSLQMPAACTLQPKEPTPCPASSASSFSNSFAMSTLDRGASAWSKVMI